MLLGTGGGGFSASASSAATSGPATQGDVGLYIGGIQTGGTQGSLPLMAWIAIAVVAALVLLPMLRRRSS